MQRIITRVNTWRGGGGLRALFASAAVVGMLTLAVKAVAFVKDLLVANQFGVSREVDAYVASFVVPQVVIYVVAGAFQSSLVPAYIEVREREGIDAARALFAAVTARAFALLGGGAVLLAILAPLVVGLIGSGFDAATRDLTTRLFLITLPAVLLNGMTILWGAVLNAHRRYALAAFAPVLVPLLQVVFMVVAAPVLGVQALMIGLTGGFAVQAALLGYALRRAGIPLRPRWRDPHPATRSVIQQFLPASAAMVLTNASVLIDQAMATPLGAGSVSTLNFGVKLIMLVLAVSVTAMSATTLTYFSQLVAEGRWDALRRHYTRIALLIVGAALPVVIGFALFSEPLVRLLYERGAFTPDDTRLVAQVQAAYFLQLPFHLLVVLNYRILAALKRNRTFFLGAAINVVSNIAFNLLFIQAFGVVGIALSTSVVNVITCAYLTWQVWRGLRRRALLDMIPGSH